MSLPPAPSGYADFWATVHVKFRTSVRLEIDLSGTPSQGYYCSFGIRAIPRRVPVVIAEAVTDGVIDWTRTEWELVKPEELEMDVRCRIEPVVEEGIWYRSGRAIYADPDLEPLPS